MNTSEKLEIVYCPQYKFEYTFHPVGQGLFASGALYKEDSSRPSYSWVYDCGTSSERKYLLDSIDVYKSKNNKGNSIDLLAISHFDADHINGMLELLKHFHVDTILLPYMPLWHRLVIGFEDQKDNPNQNLIPFFLNPVGFLFGRYKGRIREVLFVAPDGLAHDSNSLRANGVRENVELTKEGRFQLQFDETELLDTDEAAVLRSSDPSISVRFINHGSTLAIGEIWEFVPYNDQSLAPKVTAMFKTAVAIESAKLKDGDELVIAKGLDNLKELYLRTFGNSSKKKNLISLFLYGGPLYETWMTSICRKDADTSNCCDFHFCCFDFCISEKCSIMYTGDGYLNKPARLKAFKNHMNSYRIDAVAVFQVMHHGADGNSHIGVAEIFKPLVSVFSSDPSHHLQHPHPYVLRDFWKYNPCQVSKTKSANLRGILQPKY